MVVWLRKSASVRVRRAQWVANMALLACAVALCCVLSACAKASSVTLAGTEAADRLTNWRPAAFSINQIVNAAHDVENRWSGRYRDPDERVVVASFYGTLFSVDDPVRLDWSLYVRRCLYDVNYVATQEQLALARDLERAAATNDAAPDLSARFTALAPQVLGVFDAQTVATYLEPLATSDASRYSGMSRGEAFFWPMVELLTYLQEEGFDVYVVTDTDAQCVCALLDGVLDIDDDHVVAGTSRADLVAAGVPSQPVMVLGNLVDDVDVASLAESDDVLVAMVIDDDTKRTWGSAVMATEGKAACEDGGMLAISMSEDWKTVYGKGVAKFDNRSTMDYLVLVNKEVALPEGWEDGLDLVQETNSKGNHPQLDRTAYQAFVGLQQDAAEHGVSIELNSGYRSVASQEAVVEQFTVDYGQEYVNRYVAVPGHSEHHTGLAIDVYLVEDVPILTNDEIYARQATWDVVHELLPRRGFILRYPIGKEDITGYAYEPWHFRYVGAMDAQQMHDLGMTLEEYTQLQNR